MNSEQFETRLNDLLDRRIAPEADPELLRVAEQFTACRTLLGAYRAVLDGVVEMDLPRPPVDLADRILAQRRRERITNRCLAAPRRVVTGMTGRRALYAAAAALLIAGPAGWFWQETSHHHGQPIAGAKQASAPFASPAVAVAELASVPAARTPSDHSKPTIATEPAGVAGRAMDEIASLVTPAPQPSSAASSAEATPPATEGAAWMGEVSQGFQPIAESAAGALDFLLEVLADGSNGSGG
ncbi:MAG: hypothetical protein K2Y37_11300 [Pirellulales bacterium]|nr:hypothetical protein [Pirellulales bacterium]